MTLLDLVTDALDRTNYAPVTSAAGSPPAARMVRFVNQWHRKICADARFTRLRDATLTFASVAGQVRYALPSSVAKIARLYDPLQPTRLVQQSRDWARPMSALASGTPQWYIPIGLTALTSLPPTAAGFWAVSSDAADTTQRVSVQAIRSGGATHAPAATLLTGTARVQLGTRTDYLDASKAWLDSPAVGDVTIYDAATVGHVLTTIPIGHRVARYFAIECWPVPSAAITYTVEFQRTIPEMKLDADEPLLPVDFHPLLVSGAVYQELLIKKDPQTAGAALAEVQAGLVQLLAALVNSPDYLVIPDDGRSPRGGSNLGPGYPAGRW